MGPERVEVRCCQYCNEWKAIRTFHKSGSVQNTAVCAECAKAVGLVWKEGAGWVKP